MNRIQENQNGTLYRDPYLIEQDITETRSKMDSTVDKLSEKLNPSDAIQKASEWAREKVDGINTQEIKDRCQSSAQSAVETVKENPAPFALFGLAALSLLFSRKGKTEAKSSEEIPTSIPVDDLTQPSLSTKMEPPVEDGFPLQADPWAEKHSTNGPGSRNGNSDESPLETLKEKASKATEKITELTEQATTKTAEAAESLKESTVEAAKRGRDKISDVSYKVYDSTVQSASASKRAIGDGTQNNPLVAAAVALTAGLAASALLPRTRKENELCGCTADAVKDRLSAEKEKMVEQAREKLSESKLDPEGIQERVESSIDELQSKANSKIEEHIDPE